MGAMNLTGDRAGLSPRLPLWLRCVSNRTRGKGRCFISRPTDGGKLRAFGRPAGCGLISKSASGARAGLPAAVRSAGHSGNCLVEQLWLKPAETTAPTWPAPLRPQPDAARPPSFDGLCARHAPGARACSRSKWTASVCRGLSQGVAGLPNNKCALGGVGQRERDATVQGQDG
jgi:hypothetical protein